jgi:hypothetical protein
MRSYARVLTACLWAAVCVPVAYSDIPLATPPAWESMDTTCSTGAAFGDVNNDGYIDLFVSNGNDMAQDKDHVYYNLGGMLETNASWRASDSAYGGHLAIGDVDNDGDVDMAVTWYGPFPSLADGLDELYINLGIELEPTPSWRPAASDSDNSFSCAFGDVDNDGDLDLVFAAGSSRAQRSKLYVNTGGVLDTNTCWLSQYSQAYGVAWGDVNGDGYLDLALANRSGSDHLYYNHNGMLDTIPGWVSDRAEITNQIAFGDVDNDGDLDLAVSISSYNGACKVYYNIDGVLETTASWVSDGNTRVYSCVAWGDVDGDGDLDLAAGGWWEPVVVFENIDGILSTTPSWSWITDDVDDLVTEQVAWGDVDNDGLVSVSAEIHTFEGENSVVYAEHYPLHSVEWVVVDDDTLSLSEYCYDLRSGWISLGVSLPDTTHTAFFYYTYSKDLDLVVSNWERTRGNFLFLNTSYEGVHEIPAGGQHVETFGLKNCPNPFRRATTFYYYVPSHGPGSMQRSQKVAIRIFDLSGRLITTLIDCDQSPGSHRIIWDGENAYGDQLGSGVYFFHLETTTSSETKPVLLLR